jgi:hypothetical protein
MRQDLDLTIARLGEPTFASPMIERPFFDPAGRLWQNVLAVTGQPATPTTNL